MNPIIYGKTESAYTTNGLGRLTSVTKCVVTEELNGAYEMTMEVAVTDPHFSSVIVGNQVAVTVADGSLQPFRIDMITKPLNGIVSVHAYHRSYDLTRLTVVPCLIGQQTPANAWARLVSQGWIKGNNDFSFSSSIATTSSMAYYISTPVSVKNLLGDTEEETSFVSVYGGEFEWDKTTIKLLSRRGSDHGASIRYGKNLTNVSASDSGTPYNSIIGYATSNDGALVYGDVVTQTGETMDGVVPVDVTDYLSSEDLAELTKAMVNTAAGQWLEDNQPWLTTKEIRVSFTNGNGIDDIFLGDDVTVVYEDYGINEHLRVVKTVWDSLIGRYNSVDIGHPERTITKQMAKEDRQTKTEITSVHDMSQSIANGSYEGGTMISGTDVKNAALIGGSLSIGAKTAPDTGYHFMVDTNGNVTMDGGITLNGAITWGSSATGKPPQTASDIFAIMEAGNTYITRNGLYSPTISGGVVKVYDGTFELRDSQENLIGYIGANGNTNLNISFYGGETNPSSSVLVSDTGVEMWGGDVGFGTIFSRLVLKEYDIELFVPVSGGGRLQFGQDDAWLSIGNLQLHLDKTNNKASLLYEQSYDPSATRGIEVDSTGVYVVTGTSRRQL